ncbi:MAG: NifU family protein [Acidimicrobiia bacterium]|nr:NifU family protein [Acidimicrobiia bacterium]NNC76028.1 NifU family protein [Acidimicrobiia bacterium]
MSDEIKATVSLNLPTLQAQPEPAGADAAAEPIDAEVLNETLEYIRPALQTDGGDLVLLSAENGRVTLQLVGACGGCPMSTMTLTAGIERILTDRVPGVTEVVAL